MHNSGGGGGGGQYGINEAGSIGQTKGRTVPKPERETKQTTFDRYLCLNGVFLCSEQPS